MDDNYLKKILSTIILVVLLVLSFFLLKPILMAIVLGIILAYMFTPIYDWLHKITKSEYLSAFLIIAILILITLLPIWFLTPIIIEQSIKIYMLSQQVDFVAVLKGIFPSLFASEEFSAEIGSILHSFTTKITNFLMNSLSGLITNFVNLFLQSIVVFFVLFFVLKDKEKLVDYLRSLSPFSKDIDNKLFESSRGITSSVIYGQIVIGIAQGLAVSIGFFIFGVPNALLLSLLACLAGVFPIIGTTIVWLPMAIYLFIHGEVFSSMGVTFFGIISNTIDNFIRPIIVSKKTHINSALVIIGMIGGIFMFGVLGLILGPLILAYLLTILELYRGRKSPGVFIQYR